MTTGEWILTLIPTILLFNLAYWARSQFRSWLAPGAFFSLYWTVGLLLPLAVTPDFYFWPGAAWFILLFGFSHYLGSVVGWAITFIPNIKPKRQMGNKTYHLLFGKQIIILFSALGMLSVLITLIYGGYSPRYIIDPESIAWIARDLSVLRYTEYYDSPFIARLLNTFIYAGALLGGVWYALNVSISTKIWGLLPFIPALFQTLILTTRASFLFPLEFGLATYLCMIVLCNKHHSLRFRELFPKMSVIICAGVFIFVGTQMLRDKLNMDNISIAFTKFRAFVFGSPVIFSQWLQYGWYHNQPTWGAFTFSGFFDLLGIRERIQGLYSEIIYLSAFQIQAESSNIYTVFRGLIEDFTLLGAILILFGTGCAASLAFRMVSHGRIAWLPILSLFYAFTFHSLIGSFLTYNSLLLAWMIFLFCLGPIGPRLLRWKFTGQLKTK